MLFNINELDLYKHPLTAQFLLFTVKKLRNPTADSRNKNRDTATLSWLDWELQRSHIFTLQKYKFSQTALGLSRKYTVPATQKNKRGFSIVSRLFKMLLSSKMNRVAVNVHTCRLLTIDPDCCCYCSWYRACWRTPASGQPHSPAVLPVYGILCGKHDERVRGGAKKKQQPKMMIIAVMRKNSKSWATIFQRSLTSQTLLK